MRGMSIVLVALVLSSSVAFAQSNQASANVSVNVLPNIAVSHEGGTVTLNALNKVGPFSGEIAFRVDANTQQVDLSVLVSNLYKDGVPTSVSVIPVDLSAGVLVVPATALRQPIGAPNTPLAYGTASTGVGIYQGFATTVGRYGSGVAGHFSEAVAVTPTWDLQVETPVGVYGGTVILVATVVP